MRLTQIRDFVAVAEAGSISGAARRLGVSQPGLTKSIGSLEGELETPLLQRTPRGVTLTAAGKTFFARARAACAELDKGQQEIAIAAGARQGKVGVGFGPMLAVLVIPQVVLRFRSQCPDADLRLIEGYAHEQLALVRDGTLDMISGPRLPGVRHDAGIRFRPLFQHRQIVVGRRDHPQARVRSLMELVGVQWLSITPREATLKTLGAAGVRGAPDIVQCESLNAMLGLLAASDMLAVVSHRIFDMPSARQYLRRLGADDDMSSMTVGLYTRADAPLSPAAAVFADLLVDAGRHLAANGGSARA